MVRRPSQQAEEPIYANHQFMGSELTLIPSNDTANFKSLHPPSSSGKRNFSSSESILHGSPSESQFSIAVGAPSYEFYQPRPGPAHFLDNGSKVVLSQAREQTSRYIKYSHTATGQVSYPILQSSTLTLTMESPTPTQFSTNIEAGPSDTHPPQDGRMKKDWRFWTIFVSLMVVCILTALDMTMISTALPTIVRDLPVSDVSGTWITSSYLLTMTASQPAFGGLSCVAGRRWAISLAVIFFLAGSIACALSKTMLILSVSRGLQGLGGGGIQAIGEIIVSDMTTLRERGFFIGLVGLVFAVASFVAPVLGGIFSGSDWRWIFWINLPIGAVALALIVPFMKLRVPQMSMREKFDRMDLFGNLILFGSVVGILIGVTEGGITHPWNDARVYLPLAFGIGGFFLFLAVEFIPNPLCRQPILPVKLFSNLTAASAFFQTFVHGIVTYGAIYALPIFFQAIKDESALRSAISTFPATAPGAPFAIIAGIVMAITGKYKLSIWMAWTIMCVGFGWMTRFGIETPRWELYTSEFVSGVGVGMLFAITLPPIQASLPVAELEHATATYAFCRSFGSIWGIALATTVFTASVADDLKSLPETAAFGLTGTTALGFVEEIKHIPQPLQDQVRVIFANGLQKALWVFVPLAIIGFFSSAFIKELPLPDFIRSSASDQIEKQEHAQAGKDYAMNVIHSPGASTLHSPSLHSKF